MKTLKDLLPLYTNSNWLKSASVMTADGTGQAYVCTVSAHDGVWDHESLRDEICSAINSSAEKDARIKELEEQLAVANKRLVAASSLLVEARRERDAYKEYHTTCKTTHLQGMSGQNIIDFWRKSLDERPDLATIVDAWDKAAQDADGAASKSEKSDG